MSEKNLSSRAGNLMKDLEWHPLRVENGIHEGTPDCNCIHGWFEYKFVREWPKRGGPLRCPHFTAQQRIWLRQRWRAHGEEGHGAWMFIQVAKEYLLFDGETAARIVGNVGRRELYKEALGHWMKFPTATEFSGAVLL